ncbi:hypothetical protein CS369_09555 [Candidatus Symbiopectobacterium sp. 'North America']|nr:hypothetical protein [Candidatus Symbiopectobacterium sp. 'North America']
MCVGRTRYSAHPWASPLTRPPHAAFKSAPCRFVTRITYLCKLIGIHSLAAFPQLELFRL